MRTLLTADTHFTDNPRDEYRWGLFPWMIQQAKKHDAKGIILAGDMTDAKDRHSATLVNRLVASINGVLAEDIQFIFLPGNHDGIDVQQPFFRFLVDLGVMVVREPSFLDDTLLLPHTKNYEQDWKGLDFNKPNAIFTHQTYDGSITETGIKLNGIPPSVFKGIKAHVWSGDIHVPQKVSRNIEYVGAPYRIRFGDIFTPRVVMLDEKYNPTDLHFPTTNKHLVEIIDPASANRATEMLDDWLEAEGPYKGDQVKVRVRLSRKTYPEWPAIRADLVKAVLEAGLELTGPELVALPEAGLEGAEKAQIAATGALKPGQALSAYGKSKGLPKPVLEAGRGFLAEAQK